MTQSAPPGGALHKEREIELHRHVAEGYRLRCGPPFARLFQGAWNEALLGMLPAVIPSPALDDGCGTGILLPDLARRCDRVFGVDLSPDMLAQARERAEEADLRAADIENLPFPDGFFRTVVCRGSLHHAPSPGRALEEAHRVLAAGGLLALSEPSDDFAPVRWARASMYRVSSKFDVNDRAFRSGRLRTLLERSGFEVVAERRFGFAAYLLCGFPDVIPLILHLPGRLAITRALLALDRLLARTPMVRRTAFHVMLLARKPAGP